jgi:alpha-tubulin suppressor-like RCC1 family protein
VRRDTCGLCGEHAEFFTWGFGGDGLLGHGDMQSQPSPKRIEALRGIPVTNASAEKHHAVALSENGLMYSWGNGDTADFWGCPHVEKRLLPTPIEALRGVRMGSIAAAGNRTFAVADTGEAWAWGCDGDPLFPLGYGGQPGHMFCPKRVEPLQGLKIESVIVGSDLAAWCWKSMTIPWARGAALGQKYGVREFWSLKN